MRYTTLLPLVAAAGGASAFVIPDEATAKQFLSDTERSTKETLSDLWDFVSVPTAQELRTSAEDAFNNAVDAFHHQASKLQDYLPDWDVEIESEIANFLPESFRVSSKKDGDREDSRVTKPGHHGTTNLTVYQAIQASPYSKKFAALVEDFPDIVQQLNSTKANVTVFVPLDGAFDKIPDHYKGEKPPKEFVEKIVKYHVVPGYWPLGSVLAHHTLPTALKEEALGGHPQRLRASVGIFGVRINFYAKLGFANLYSKNGLVHGVASILVPPPPAGKLISLFPSKFSTLLLALEKTELVDEQGVMTATSATSEGKTVFAPTNHAFQKLGPGANAFLFNTEKGLRYLKALLLYHLVEGETLYSDAYYPGEKKKDGDDDMEIKETWHVDLPTALEDKSLSVDIAKWFGFITMKVNGFTKVETQDGLAKDGVVHVLDSVLIPPHKHKGEWNAESGVEISVEELIERLEPYSEQGDSAEQEL